MFDFQSILLNLFLWIFRYFMRFFRKLKTQVFSPLMLPVRLWRSTGPRVGRSDRSTDVHKVMNADQPLEPVDRAVDRLQVPHSRVGAVDRTVDREQGTVDRAVDRPESNCSLDWHDRPGGRPAGSTVKNLTVGRSTGRPILA